MLKHVAKNVFLSLLTSPSSAMQEDALKLVLLALEDGSALSRKVLVLFVVQKLEARFPQASKTSIGHVVQLLYRASCFKVRDAACMHTCSSANMCGNGEHVIINGIIQTGGGRRRQTEQKNLSLLLSPESRL